MRGPLGAQRYKPQPKEKRPPMTLERALRIALVELFSFVLVALKIAKQRVEPGEGESESEAAKAFLRAKAPRPVRRFMTFCKGASHG